MCGECSNCFPSIEDCKEHMINVIAWSVVKELSHCD